MKQSGAGMERILAMIPYVRAHPGIPVRELARYLDCTPDAVLADLDRVLMCGVPPYLPNDYIGVYVQDARVWLRFADHFRRPLNFTLREALSLRLAVASIPAPPAVADRLLQRIDDMLPPVLQGRVRTASKRIRVRQTPGPLSARVRRIQDAIARNREIRIRYYTASRDAMTERTVRPYALIDHQGEWYLVGHCLLRDRELPFRVSRIQSMQMRRATFTVPPDFDLSRYQREEMFLPPPQPTRVEIWIHADLARWVEEEMAGGEVKRLPGGHRLLKIDVSRPEWILTWALKYGPRVHILRPPEIRERMRALTEEVLASYQ